MEIIAFILAIVAIICFGTARIAYGLAFLTAAWICQLVITTGSHLHIT